MKNVEPESPAFIHPLSQKSPPTNLLSLNDDILYILMEEFSAKNDLLLFMRVSFRLYNLGIPVLLKGTIALKTEYSVYSFRCFMMARTSQERALLRKLKICKGNWHTHCHSVTVSSVRNSIAIILRYATHLESLEIEVCHPILDKGKPTAIRALASMTTLRHLALGDLADASNAIRKLFEDFSSPISTLVVGGLVGRGWDRTPGILLRVKDSLTRLSLSVVPSFLSLTPLQLLHVEELSLKVKGEPVSPEDLPRVFPKLRGLSMTIYNSMEGLWESGEEGSIIRRGHNSFNRSSLDFVSSDPHSLLSFGPTCPIRYVHAGSVDSHSFNAFCRFLASAKPSVLRFEFTLLGAPWNRFNIDVDTLFHTILAIPQLVELYIGLTFAVVDPTDSENFSNAWESFLRFLQRSSITTLAVKVIVLHDNRNIPSFQKGATKDRALEVIQKMPKLLRLLMSIYWDRADEEHWHFHRGKPDVSEEVDKESMKVYWKEIEGPIWEHHRRRCWSF